MRRTFGRRLRARAGSRLRPLGEDAITTLMAGVNVPVPAVGTAFADAFASNAVITNFASSHAMIQCMNHQMCYICVNCGSSLGAWKTVAQDAVHVHQQMVKQSPDRYRNHVAHMGIDIDGHWTAVDPIHSRFLGYHTSALRTRIMRELRDTEPPF